jgi:hypothetical protein
MSRTFVLSVALACAAVPEVGADGGKDRPTTVVVVARRWTKAGGYLLPAAKVKVVVVQDNGRLKPKAGEGEGGNWVTDKDGKCVIKVASGGPFRVFVYGGGGTVPEMHDLTAEDGEEHRLGVALLGLADHMKRESQGSLTAGLKIRELLAATKPDKNSPPSDKAMRESLTADRKIATRADDHPSLKNAPQSRKFTPLEQKAVTACLATIRSCQLQGGAFRGSSAGAPVVIKPDMGHRAALALLAPKAPPKADVAMVGEWLKWYAKNIESPLGIAMTYDGMLGQLPYRKVTDSTNGYSMVPTTAALYLLVAARHQRAGGKTTPELMRAAERSLLAVEVMKDDDGLTLAKPDHEFKYLDGNVWVYAGLVEGGDLFRRNGKQAWADRAFEAADRLAAAMKAFEDDGRFSRCIPKDGTPEAPFAVAVKESCALPNLFALAHVPSLKAEARKKLWAKLNDDYKADGGPAPQHPPEQWVLAADAVDAAVAQKLRRELANEALRFTKALYLDRFSGTVLALVDGPARLPAVLVPTPPE